jgi:polysaccharide export outer membrane protein
MLVALCANAQVGADGNTQPEARWLKKAYFDSTALRPGDGLRIRVYPDSMGFPNGDYPIDENGFADLPIAGRVRVAGETPQKVAQVLRSMYVNYLPRPNVQVRPLIRISLLGGFYEPGLYYIEPYSSLWQAVQLAGGTQRQDGLSRLRWERGGEIVDAQVAGLVGSGRSLQELGFQSGDQLTVTELPRRGFWNIVTDDVLPVLSFALTAATAVATLSIAVDNN